MSLRALALDWSLDGSVGIAFLVVCVAAGGVYASAAAIGSRRDRRHRRWPWRRTACFCGGLAVLVIDLYAGIGTQADLRLSTHMLEHMVMWLVVAPLLAAGAPIRLAFFVLGRGGRRRLAGWLHSRPLAWLTSPVGSVTLFSAVLLATHVPAVYGLALGNDTAHEAEHALYLAAALLMWAPLLGVDPLPRRLSARGRTACLATCMVPMLLGGVAGDRAPRRVSPLCGGTRIGGAARPAPGGHDHVGGRAARVCRPGAAQTYELTSASLTGGVCVVSTVGADNDVIRGLAVALELPETSAASA
jgi:putative membrane protein